ncbi:MAG: TVP38/TMEM64 family protein [Chloroflexota bacterium]|nr:TVP38/TMEM64 family protein [Chloroflexota bacterium]
MKDDDGLLHPPRALDLFIEEGEDTPLLLQRRVIVAIVVGFVLLVAAYAVASRVYGLSSTIDAEPFRDWVSQWGLWGPLVYIAVLALSVLFAPIPNVPISIAAGLAWGPVLGTVYSMLGMTLGSALAFGVARKLGRRHLRRLIGSKAARQIDRLAETMGGQVIFWARMLPVVNFDLISFVAGLTAISFWRFLIASFLGMLVPTTIAVVAGDSLGRDIRITLGLGAFWVAGIVGSAAYVWYRRRHLRAAMQPLPASVSRLDSGERPAPEGESPDAAARSASARSR